jgi:hypothetical protein
MPSALVIQQSSITGAWRRAGGDDTWLELRTDSGDLADVVAAAKRANETAETRGGGDHAAAAIPAATPRGFAVRLMWASALPAVHRWIEDFSKELANHGFVGTLRGAPQASLTPCLDSSLPPTPTGFVAWVLDLPRMKDDPARWFVAPEATARIAKAADRWARRAGTELVFKPDGFPMRIDLDDAGPALATSVAQTGMAGLDFRNNALGIANHVGLSFGGDGVFQTLDESISWQERIEKLTSAITALPRDMNHAYIRPASRGAVGHHHIDVVLPLPDIAEHHVRANKHLLDRYLPDAHGVQVVRTAHLTKAHDLTHWEMTDLGDGRHLVRANDLAAWYAEVRPNPSTLAQARADFGDALLTEQIIAANQQGAAASTGDT